ncbi:MAG TPA: hypothetical protein VGM14_20105, partial [Streptosporangiaceae bacterium]
PDRTSRGYLRTERSAALDEPGAAGADVEDQPGDGQGRRDERVRGQGLRIQAARQAADYPSLASDCEAYLDACADPAFFQITADGPAVLGWDYLVAQTSRLIELGLTDARDRDEIIDVPIEPLSRMLAAALKEAGVIIATAGDPAAARNEASVTARHLIGGLLRNKPVPET